MSTIPVLDGTHLAFVGDDAVCLDLARDRYFGLVGRTALALRACVERTPSDTHLAAIDALKARTGLRGCPSEWCIPSPPPALASLLDEPLPRAGASDLCAMAIRLHQAHRRLRKGLASALLPLAHAERGRRSQANGDRRLRAICAAHYRGGLLLSAVDTCLPRSIALVDHLRRADLDASLIMGVTLRPFRAHCWAQQETVVLNDRPEHVRAFIPILVL